MDDAVAWLALAFGVLTLLVCVALLWWIRALRRVVTDLQRDLATLPDPVPLAPELSRALGSGERRVLVLEILNPIELATSQNRAASVLAAGRPSLLSKIVYDQAHKMVVKQLAEHGVEASVSVHVVR